MDRGDQTSSGRAAAWTAAAVAAVTFMAFLPVLHNGWIPDWDDGTLFLDNPHFRGLSPRHLFWMFTTAWDGPYQPLPWISYALDHKLWGLAPAGYHLTSLLLHCLNAVLFFFVARRVLTLARPSGAAPSAAAAMFAALAFAVHPLRVESVAWISERRDVLCGTFYLAAIWSYLDASLRRRTLLWPAVFFIAALLSKAMAVSLPIAFLILDVHPLRRLDGDAKSRPLIREKLPFFLISAGMGIVALRAQSSVHSVWSLSRYGCAQRLCQASYSAFFYIIKTLFPFRLGPIYEMPADPRPLKLWLWLAMAALTTLLAWRWRKDRPSLAASWAAYLTALAPVSGLLQTGYQVAADRYSYIPCLGGALLAAGWLRRGLEGPYRILWRSAAATLLLSWGVLSWRQSQVWKDPVSLWAHTLSIDPDNTVANIDMGDEMTRAGRTAEAERYFARALFANPVCIPAEDALMSSLAKGERPRDADRLLSILEANPNCRKARRNWVTARAALGDTDQAVIYLQNTLLLQPQDGWARSNLAWAKRLKSRREPASP